MCGIEFYIIKAQFRWADHLVHMSNDRIPKQLFFGQLKEGKQHHRVSNAKSIRALLKMASKIFYQSHHLRVYCSGSTPVSVVQVYKF